MHPEHIPTPSLPDHDPEVAMVWKRANDGSISGSIVAESDETQIVSVNSPLLDKNDRAAERNRAFCKSQRLIAINLVSSPGSGKTALLERTLADFGANHTSAVIVGDLETDNDARRLRGKNAEVVQITTGNACHLDAEMVENGLRVLAPISHGYLFIENVGNLVCPASFDLGEFQRVVLLSCTEGEDKPLKYPPIFKSASVVLLTKTDIAPALEFSIPLALSNIRKIAPQATIIALSSKSGAGIADWYSYLSALSFP